MRSLPAILTWFLVGLSLLIGVLCIAVTASSGRGLAEERLAVELSQLRAVDGQAQGLSR